MDVLGRDCDGTHHWRREPDVKKLEKILNDYREMPLSQEIGARARQLMKTHAKPHGLLPLDALIAATALYEGVRLATKNKKQFRNIEGVGGELLRSGGDERLIKSATVLLPLV